MNYWITFFAILIFMILSEYVNAQITVGVSPPIIDLGEIEKGETKIARFNVITSSEDTLIVRLEATRGKADFFTGNYVNYIHNYSEEDIKPWIEFLSNPVELRPASIQGTTIKNIREATFLVSVPEDAEPGYHNGYVMLDPRITEDVNKQVTIKTVVPLTILFKVPGDPVREGKIYDITLRGYSRDTAYFDIFFHNTGSVTMLVKTGKIEIFDIFNNSVGSVLIPSGYVEPGQIKTFNALWDINDTFIPGTYRLEAEMDYSSGKAEKISYIQLYEKPSLPAPRIVEKKEEGISIWLVLLILLLVIGVVYWWYKK